MVAKDIAMRHIPTLEGSEKYRSFNQKPWKALAWKD
jgi:hypothetical protein